MNDRHFAMRNRVDLLDSTFYRSHAVSASRMFAQLAALFLVIGASPAIFAVLPAPAAFETSVTVIPDVAPYFSMRTIVINGTWPNGCVPRTAILNQSDLGPIGISLQRPPETVCTQATTRFSVSVPFSGIAPAPVFVSVDGATIAEGFVRTVRSESIPPLMPIITVVPEVDVANRARTIVITGQTYAGCPYSEPSIDAAASQLIGGVVVRMNPVQTLAPCSITLSPYRFDVPYIPSTAGTQRVVAASNSGTVLSETKIRTALPGATRAAGDVTGMWYDPLTDGSGLQFTHNFFGTDVVFGTWYLYDLDGRARWLSIQGVTWHTRGTAFSGDLYETRATTAFCTAQGCPQDVLLPTRAAATTRIGTVRVSFTGIAPYSDTATQGIAEAFSPGGATLFKSTITRIGL